MKKIITLVVLFFCLNNFLAAQPTITDIQPQGGGTTLSTACIGQSIRLIGGGYQPTGLTITINGGSIISVYTFINPGTIEFQIPIGTPLSGTGVIVTVLSQSSTGRSLFINAGTTIVSQPTQQEVCEGAPFNFAVNAVGGSLAYLWKRNAVSTGVNTTTISGTSLLSDSGAVYTVDVINSSCGTVTPSNPVKLLVNKKPNNPPTLPNINHCQDGNFTLNAPPPNVGSGLWSCVSNCTGVNIANNGLPNANVTGVPLSAAPQLRWTVINGSCATSSDVTIPNYAMPTTTAITAGISDTSICITSPPVNLLGTVASGTFTNVDWTLQGPSTGNFSTATNFYTTFTPTSGAGAYKINYIIRNGACNSISPDKKINVYNSPTVSAGGTYTACFGVPLNFTGNATNGVAFSWATDGGNGILSSVNSLNSLYSMAGDDSLGITFALSLTTSNPGCGIVADTTTVTIRSKPHVFIPSGSDNAVCAGGTASFPINFTGTPPFSGIGLFNGVTNTNLGTISGTTFIANVNPTANTNYTLSPVGSFIDGNSCPGAWQGSSFITVLPGATASIAINPAIICSGDNATLSITPSGAGASTWKVYVNTGGANTMISMSGLTTSTISPTSTTTYTIDSIETAGCGKLKLIGISKSILVNSPPTVSAAMTITASDDTLCQGESTTISITGLQTNTIYRLIKKFNNISLDSIVVGNTTPGTLDVTIPYSKFTPGTIDTVRFLARRQGCFGVVPSVTKAYIWTSNLTSPVISISAATAACERKILTTTTLPNVLYQWYEGTSTLVKGIYDKDTAFFSGNYSVKAKDTLLCKLASNSINVNYIAQQPLVSGADLSSTETKLSAAAIADKYYWYAETSSGIKKIQGSNGNNISVYFDGNYYLGAVNGTCLFMSAPYSVSGKLGGNLLRQSFVETDSTIILPEVDFTVNVRVYPNPVNNSDFTVDYIAGNATKVSFTLYNPQGLPVLEKEAEGNGIIRVNMPTKSLPTGIYNLYIFDGVKRESKSIMIY